MTMWVHTAGTACILFPRPPDTFILRMGQTCVVINPSSPHILTRLAERTLGQILVLISLGKIYEMADRIGKDYYVAVPPLGGYVSPYVSVFPVESRIPLSRDMSAYFLKPKSILGETNDHFILLDMGPLRIMVSTYLTYVPDPPVVDLVLTTQSVLSKIRTIAKEPGEEPYYLGCDAQWCFVLGETEKISGQYIYLSTTPYIVHRHLTSVHISPYRRHAERPDI